MVSCSVKGCKSRSQREGPNITFHTFPKTPNVRSKWILATGRLNWVPTYNNKFCSKHFSNSCFYTTNKKTFLYPDALPTQNLPSRKGSERKRKTSKTNGKALKTKSRLRVCLICLGTQLKLLPISKYGLDQTYEHVTGFPVSTKNNLPQYMCVECAQRLINCRDFQSKCLKSRTLLLDLVSDNYNINMDIIKTINREANNLCSSLSMTSLHPKHIIHFKHCDEKVQSENNIEIKSENDSDEDAEYLIQEEYLDEEYLNDNLNCIKNKDNKISDRVDNQDFHDQVETDCDEKSLDKELKQKLEEFSDQVNAGEETDSDEKDFKDDNVTVDALQLEPDLEVFQEEIIGEEESDSCDEKDFKDENVTAGILQLEPELRDSYEQKIDEDETDVDDKNIDSNSTNNTSENIKDSKTQKLKRNSGSNGKVLEVKDKQTTLINPELFNIIELTIEEKIEALKKKQQYKKYRDALFRCTKCYTGFLRKEDYETHMARHSEDRGQFECPVCKFRYKSQYLIQKHMSKHGPKYECKLCSYVSMKRETVNKHGLWHAGAKYKCPQCPIEFEKVSSYFAHLRLKHPTDFICELCGYSFINERGLHSHKLIVHKHDNKEIPENGPVCEPCNIKFQSAAAYQTHLSASSKHTTSKFKNYKKTKYNYNNKRTVAPEKGSNIVPCEQCGVEIDTGRDGHAYAKHFREVHPGQNRTQFAVGKCMCEICGRICRTYAILKYHSLRHTQTRPFPCEVCGRRFSSKCNLRKHSGVHTGGLPCSVCGKTFASKISLDTHIRVKHEGYRPHKCEMCGKAFSERCQKLAHIHYVHNNNPWPKRNRQPKQKEPEKFSPKILKVTFGPKRKLSTMSNTTAKEKTAKVSSFN